MPKVPYRTSDAMVSVLSSLNLLDTYAISLGDRYVFTDSGWNGAVNYLGGLIDANYDDGDEENNYLVWPYEDALNGGAGIIYWSTEGHFWY